LTAIGTCSTLTLFFVFWAQPLYTASRECAVAIANHPEPRALVTTEAVDESARARAKAAEAAVRKSRIYSLPPSSNQP
jgi:hypothetical protein